jgi:hypothetical protein
MLNEDLIDGPHASGERMRRFKQFTMAHIAAVADRARRGFAENGPGVVLIDVASLDGGEAFSPQQYLELAYKSKASVKADNRRHGTPDPLIEGLLGRYNPPREMLVAAVYPNAGYDVSRMRVPTAEEIRRLVHGA